MSFNIPTPHALTELTDVPDDGLVVLGHDAIKGINIDKHEDPSK